MTSGEAAEPRLAVTVAVVHDDPFEVLMVRRPARGAFPDALVFPGGQVDPGETLEQAAVRETLEETQVDISGRALVPFGHWITPAPAPRRFDTYFLLAELDHAAPAVVNEGELDEVFWIAPSEALRRGIAREELVILPTLAHLMVLVEAGSSAAAAAAARALPDTPVISVSRSDPDGSRFAYIPPEAGYPFTRWPERATTA